MTVPGQGSQEVLTRAPAFTAAPTDGKTYPLVTRNNWQVGCLSSIQNGSGEGFFAISPEGLKYRFDWMALRDQTDVKKSGANIARSDHFLMATEVVDRFGNWVRYTYDPASPISLTRIESSDGRLVIITNTGGRAVSVSDGTRNFTYSYTSLGSLGAVIQPDGSRWTFNLTGMTTVNLSDMGEGSTVNSLEPCPRTILWAP